MNQSDMIHNTNWDILFIIDACRYDMLEKYRDLLGAGNLKKVISPSTFTMGWLIDNFEDRPQLNATYVSSDFEVSSKGVGFKKIYDRERKKRYGNVKFDCRKYFKEIVDVWDFGVDKRFGIVTPETIIEEVEKVVKQNKRVIGKFWQVHDPYLYYLESTNNYKVLHLANKLEDRVKNYKWINIKRVLRKYFSEELVWKIKRFYKSNNEQGLYYFWKNFGREGIIKGYTEDLKRTLQCIKEFSDKYPDKKIVVTSDHGEFLGEKGRFGHGVACENYKVIQEVPWFVIGEKDGDN